MFETAFSIYAIFAVIHSVLVVHMKIEVNRRVLPHDRISWWAFDTKNEIAGKYRTIEPESALPAISRITWWLCLLTLVGMLSTVILDR